MVNGSVNPLACDLDHILSHTDRLWEEFRDRRVFITGGTGFFGTWLLEAFVWANKRLDLNVEITVLTRDPAPFKRKAPHLASDTSILFQIGDVRDFAFAPGRFSYIIHASNEGHFDPSLATCRFITENISRAAAHVLDFAVCCSAKRLLFTSSGTVYGPPPDDGCVSEEYGGVRDTSVPRFAHGEGKHEAERLLVEYWKEHGIEAKIARCFSFVGPYMPLEEGYAIGNFIRDGMQEETIFVNGDGTPIRSYLYTSDLIIWLLTILIEGEPCRPYNVGSENEIDIGSLARMVNEGFGGAKKVRIARDPTPGMSPERYVPCTNRAKKELGLEQHVSLPEAIRKTLSWYEGKGRSIST
ncbi:MAG: NAD(P)-dependent oxidoreductase [Desulfobacteraceae bacterium]|nr:MAG: NAD(P)-dependent oxidoreductase [Desulfobacteraceae bacterium]